MTLVVQSSKSTEATLTSRIYELEHECAVLRDRNDLGSRILEIHRTLASMRDADGIVTALLYALRDLLGFSRVMYATVNRDRGVDVRFKTEDGGFVESVREPIDIDAGSALLDVLRGATHTMGYATELSAPLIDVRAWYVLCPLSFSEATAAIVYVDGYPLPPTQSHVDFMRSLCAVAAVALANARTFASTTELAERDPLTGLLNRRGFERRLRALLAAPDPIAPFAYLFIDIDDFKAVNDEGGHASGDAVLITIATILQQTSRSGDLVGRFAGDEFNLAMLGVDEDLARTLVRRLSGRLRSSGHRCSIGVALFPKNALTESQLVGAADEALYATKRNGKNGYSFYHAASSATPE